MNVCSVLFLDLFISTLLGICISEFIPGYFSSTVSWLLRFVFLVFPCGCGYCLISLSELKTFPELREMFLGKVTKSWNKFLYVLLFYGYCMASHLKYLFYIGDFLKMLHWRTKFCFLCHISLMNPSDNVYMRLTLYTHFYWTSRIVQTVMHLNSIIWFLSVKHTFILYLMHYLGNMFRLTIESSSGPYIKIQILIRSKCVMGSQTLTCFVLIYITTNNTMLLLHW